MRPAKRHQQRPTRLTGGTAKAGVAYFYLFPFDIFHELTAEPFEFTHGGSTAVVYPPFANGGQQDRPVQQVRLDSVPRRQGTAMPHIGAPMLNRFRATSNWGADVLRADALRVDWYGDGAPHRRVSRLLDLLRILTVQWWITRDRRPDEGYLRNSFSINRVGERLDGLSVYAKVAGRSRLEHPATRKEFEDSVRWAMRGYKASLFMLTFCDAEYFLAVGDVRRFIIEAAITVEIVLRSESIRAATAIGVDQELIARFSRLKKFEQRLGFLPELFQRPLQDDDIDITSWLRAVWVARNNVAHGAEAVVKVGDEPARALVSGDPGNMAKAMQKFLLWHYDIQKFELGKPESTGG